MSSSYRATGKLMVDEELRSTLALMRVRLGLGPASLPLDSVRAVEERLSRRLPDEIWALYAAAGTAPDRIRRLTEEARAQLGLEDHWVAFGKNHDEGGYFCVDCREAAGIGPVGVWALGPGQPSRRSWASLADFVCWRYDLAEGPIDDPPFYSECLLLAEELALFRPELEAPPEQAPAPAARRVFHPKFGYGVVRQEIPAQITKLLIDFDTAGPKLLLATYVHDAAEQPAEITGRPVEPTRRRRGRRQAA